jgi:hypothetical protein
MKTKITLLAIFFFFCANIFPQTVLFRSGRFLHHSTGGCIWGPNGSSTSVPLQMTAYNTLHGYTGQYAVTMTESGWPVTPWDNEWERWHRIFENRDTVLADIRPILQSNKIVVIKSCFPSSSITGIGSPSDTLSPTNKTIYNYKWHWRHFVNRMRTRPQNFFVIWTNAPLVAGSTNINAARWSKQFCKWAKDTLAAGLDPVIGNFPQNIYVFDFFAKLTDTTGYMLPQYAASSSDSHPNAAATTLVAPQFVQEIFNHSIAYESIYTGLKLVNNEIPSAYSLSQNYPNPFNPRTKIEFKIPSWEGYGVSRGVGLVILQVFDITGREVQTLIKEELQPGTYEVTLDGSTLNSGIYFYTLKAGRYSETKKMVLIK